MNASATWRFFRQNRDGFTLLEMLAAVTITILLVLMLTTAFNQSSKAWLQSERQTDTAARARIALEMMARDISQAIVSPVYTFLGHSNHVAFIKPDVVPENPSLGASVYARPLVDLTETMYQQWGGGRPYDIMQRRSMNDKTGVENYWDVQSHPYHNYPPPPNPLNYNFAPRRANWPWTIVDSGRIIDYVANLEFRYYTNAPSSHSPVSSWYWNSDTNKEAITACFQPYDYAPLAQGIDLPAGTDGSGNTIIMTNRLPWGVEIILDVMDARAANRLSPGMSSAVSNSIINEARRRFSIFAHIRAAQP